jgi:hypothetical protein
VRSVIAVDLNEKPMPGGSDAVEILEGDTVRCPLAPWSVAGFIATF